ncbi:hypothetical protein MRB53_021503 [Persea americana]|uniref:Uncharacterized protein n=1 Tax=Persea americana TaxID=3435 RepID=A0ACC2L3X2_PERAE|nr:hypothetical protein MRB53_021503 [Persea americana]
MRNFLWSGSGQSTKINYVYWNLVSLPKSEGGLGIRKISEVNDACLSSLVGKPPLVPLSGVHGFKSATSNPTPFEAQQTQTMVHAFGKKLVASLSSLNREATDQRVSSLFPNGVLNIPLSVPEDIWNLLLQGYFQSSPIPKYTRRPADTIVCMLGNGTATLPSPKPPTFPTVTSSVSMQSGFKETHTVSINEVTVTMVEPR